MALIWDNTVSLGSVLTALSFLLTIIAVAWRNAMVLARALEQFARLGVQVDALALEVRALAHEVTKFEVFQQRFMDGDRRIAALEDDLRELRKSRP